MTDRYRAVTTRFRGISPSGKAVFVDKPDTRGHGTMSIPRSLVHGADDMVFDQCFDGDEITFRMMAWKAEEAGWL